MARKTASKFEDKMSLRGQEGEKEGSIADSQQLVEEVSNNLWKNYSPQTRKKKSESPHDAIAE